MPKLALSGAAVVAILGGIGAAVLVAIALGDSAPWLVKVPVATVGGATIGLIGLGYATPGSDQAEDSDDGEC